MRLAKDPAREVGTVLEAVASYGLVGTRHVLPRRPLADEAWASLLCLAAEEHLVGLLGAALGDAVFPASDEQIEQAGALHTDVSVVSLLLERLLLYVAECLARSDVEFRVLKGPAVAHLDYSQPALRTFGDIDILVRSGDFGLAVQALEAERGSRQVPEVRPGFDRRFGKGAVIVMPDELELDLHRTLVAGPLGIANDHGELFASSAGFLLGDQDLPALGRVERLLHACLHAGLGRPARLSSLRDVAEMVLSPDLDLDSLFRLAEAWNARAVVGRAVNLAWTTLDIGDSIALSEWARGYRPNAGEARVLDSYLGGDQSYTRQAIATMRWIPRWRDKFAFANSLMFPQSGYLEARRTNRVAHLRRGTSHLLGSSMR